MSFFIRFPIYYTFKNVFEIKMDFHDIINIYIYMYVLVCMLFV